jgi:hypothetical protein
VWCLAHLLQLAVRDVIDVAEQPYRQDIMLIREWVKVLRSHIVLRELLAAFLKSKGKPVTQVQLDVDTRWNSVLIMVTSFLRVWSDAIEPMIEEKLLNDYVTANQDISGEVIVRLQAMCTVLQHVASVTKLAGLRDFPAICSYSTLAH